ncbi:DUF2982 domain-containing protein [Pseudoalteromonas spongiae]|uniref:DUF2982 domain-containing protein n=1 Tax=Pseudoalteromonas spongiae TaxID=298657 RepID=A0ABU8ETS8_9GAMM
MAKRLKIAASAHKHGGEFLVAGSIVLVLVLLFVKLKPEPISIFDVAVVIGALFAMFIGYFKLSEPRYNLVLSNNGLVFYHRYGKVRISRDNIAEVGQVSIANDEQFIELSCLGLRLKSIAPLIKRMPPRLALKLIMEQRNWLIAGIKVKWPLGNVPDDWLIEANQYQDKFESNGLLAMMSHRLEHFNELYGYHFLISYNYFDRPADEFVNLLQHWLRDPEKTIEKYSNIK